jgi:hypothetical protein
MQEENKINLPSNDVVASVQSSMKSDPAISGHKIDNTISTQYD